MADAKHAKHVVTNASGGPKVLNSIPPQILQPGASTDGPVAISAAEIAVAKEHGWFEFGDADETPEPGPLDQSVDKLTAYLDGVTDADEVQKLIDAETAGKSRTGALAALEARRDALLA